MLREVASHTGEPLDTRGWGGTTPPRYEGWGGTTPPRYEGVMPCPLVTRGWGDAMPPSYEEVYGASQRSALEQNNVTKTQLCTSLYGTPDNTLLCINQFVVTHCIYSLVHRLKVTHTHTHHSAAAAPSLKTAEEPAAKLSVGGVEVDPDEAYKGKMLYDYEAQSEGELTVNAGEVHPLPDPQG